MACPFVCDLIDRPDTLVLFFAVKDPEYVIIKEAHSAFVTDVSIEESTSRIKLMRPQSMRSFQSPVQSVF